jgi:predicted KAP-like P-loop ATPase
MGKPSDRNAVEPRLSGDRPLTDPACDRLGYAPFAERLADAILRLPSDEGVVIALHGAWGSGKTTALNFVRHFISAKPSS